MNKLILPGKGRKYSGSRSKGLVWLRNSRGWHFPNHYIRKNSKTVLLYSHGNGGTLGDFKHIVSFYAEWCVESCSPPQTSSSTNNFLTPQSRPSSLPFQKRFNMSVFAIEYPSYGPAEGEASEETVNDNLYTAFNFLTQVLGYPLSNIILLGYSIGTGPTISLGAELCEKGTPPGAVITVAAFMSVCDIVRDWRGAVFVNLLADVVANRWNSMSRVPKLTCPTFFIHGVLDEMIPAEHSQRLLTACGSREKRLRLCPQADHTHFDEPGDTIEPIGLFIQEVLKPNLKAVVRPVPNEYYLCPQSVRDREAEARMKEIGSRTEDGMTEIGETPCNLMCIESSILSPFVWMGGLFGTGADGASSSSSSGSGGEGSRGGGSKGRGKDLLPKDDGSPSKSRRVALPATPDTPGTAEKAGAISEAQALEALNRYFTSLCDHNVNAAVDCLDADVLVRYPEAGKGWSTASTARQKYARMISRAPAFKASFVAQDVTIERAVSTIKATCHFECAVSGLNVTRDILYVVGGDGRIILIDHK